MARIYRIETALGTFHARRVDVQPFQHPSEVARKTVYEQSTSDGTVIPGVSNFFNSVSEEDILKAGGVLISEA
jgi:hypothetical protein